MPAGEYVFQVQVRGAMRCAWGIGIHLLGTPRGRSSAPSESWTQLESLHDSQRRYSGDRELVRCSWRTLDDPWRELATP